MLWVNFSTQSHKIFSSARASVFLGYPSGYKGYKLLDLKINKIHISRHVVFHESIFPFANSQLASTQNDFFSDYVLPTPISSSSNIPTPPTSSSPHLVHVPLPSVPTTQPQRVTKPPSYLSDYHCYLATHSSPIIHINPSFSTSHYPASLAIIDWLYLFSSLF